MLPKSIDLQRKRDLIYTNTGLSIHIIDKLNNEELNTLYCGIAVLVKKMAEDNSERAWLYHFATTCTEDTAKQVNNKIKTTF